MASPLRSVALTSLAASAAALAIAGPAGAAVTRTTLSGPSLDTAAGSPQISLDAAPDGTVAAAFLKTIGGQTHVFVARGSNGTLGEAKRVDTTLSDPSGAPVVGVGNGGRVFVAFPNGPAAAEKLYKVTADATADALTAPAVIEGVTTGWKGLGIDVAPNGDGYLTAYETFKLHAFRIAGPTATAVGGSGAPGVLNQNPAEQAETGDQRGVRLAVDPSGATAVLAWSETAGVGAYKVWARKLSGAATGDIGAAASPEITALDGKPNADGADDMTWVANGGGQTFVGFREQFTYAGATNRARLLIRSFDGATFGPTKVLDGLPAAPTEGAEFPRFALNAAGQGLSGSYRQLTSSTESATKPAGGDWGAGAFVPGFPATTVPGRATVGLTEAGVGFLAAANGAPGNVHVVSKVSGGPQDGTVATLDDTTLGTADAISEAATGADFALVAYRQGTAATSRVTVAKVDLPAPPTTSPTPTPSGSSGSNASPIVPQFSFLRLSKLRIKRADLRPAVISPSAKSKQPYFEFNVDRAARIAFWAERVTKGRRGTGGKCEKPTKANRKRKACTKYALIPGQTVVFDRPPGTTRIRFTGRLTGKHALPAGTYRLALTAADQGTGGLSPIQHLTLTLR